MPHPPARPTTRPRRRCTVPSCPHPATPGGKCSSHRSAIDSARKAGTIYNTRRWRRLSKRILTLEPICRRCLSAPSTDADHIQPIEDNGKAWDTHNLQGLCHECHARKTAEDLRRRRARRG